MILLALFGLIRAGGLFLEPNEELFSLKWYKEDTEFYRYTPPEGGSQSQSSRRKIGRWRAAVVCCLLAREQHAPGQNLCL